MPITPGTPNARVYNLNFTVDNINFQAHTIDIVSNQSAVDAAAQKLADTIDATPDMVFYSGARAMEAGDEITPTP